MHALDVFLNKGFVPNAKVEPYLYSVCLGGTSMNL